jgi:hypothetical protein
MVAVVISKKNITPPPLVTGLAHRIAYDLSVLPFFYTQKKKFFHVFILRLPSSMSQ